MVRTLPGVSYRYRPELNRGLAPLRAGDFVTVWKLDSLARSTRNLFEIIETIANAGARFQSVSEPSADRSTHSGKMIMAVFAEIAEFERDLIRERTGAGRLDSKNVVSALAHPKDERRP